MASADHTTAAPAADTGGDTAILRMKRISKSFGPVCALDDVSLTLRRGTVHALVGENGAGKSTLMKILAGVYRPDAGSLEINGAEVNFTAPGHALAAGVSMIYQELDLAEHLTAAENVFLGAEPRHPAFPLIIDYRTMNAVTRTYAEELGIALDPTTPVEVLSTGDCQVVEIIKAIRRNASIIVMDEPTSSLPEHEVSQLFRTVKQLRSEGYSIIYISHRLEELEGLIDDISILRDGSLVHSERNASVDIPAIVKHMVGRSVDTYYPPRDADIGDVVFRAETLSSRAGIEDISFAVRAGEIVGMAGLIGSGRTETARTLFGIDEKVGGRMELRGEEYSPASPAAAIAAGVAFLTEDRKRTGLCLNLPCSWNVTFPNLAKLGMRWLIHHRREREAVNELTSQVSIKWSSPEAPVDSLSGGNQQKLVIARWLMADTDFLICDEPTRGIDVGAKAEVYALLNRFAEKGKAILFISSELPELFGITDRILVMRRGNMVGTLVTAETSQEEIMRLAAVEEDPTPAGRGAGEPEASRTDERKEQST